MFYNCTGIGTHAVDYFVFSDYNAYYANTANYGSNMVAGAHDKTNVDPIGTGSIKYITRVEADSSLSGQGQGGADIGANIITQIGISGTLWGDTGYNTDTGIPLWPFPNEVLIQSQMQAYNGYGINGNRGFCNGTTLTKYVWQYLGNTMPSQVFVLKSPSDLCAQSVSKSQVNLTWVNNSTGFDTGFIVFRSNDPNGSFVQISTVGANTLSYADTGVLQGLTYYYKVKAYNNSGESDCSNVAAIILNVSNLSTQANVPVGDVKIIGPAETRGVVCPSRGDCAKIQFNSSAQGMFECKIFDLSGKLVYETSMNNVCAGTFEWFPKDVHSGGYIAEIKGPGIDVKKKIAVLK
jgi:hypothetical protein